MKTCALLVTAVIPTIATLASADTRTYDLIDIGLKSGRHDGGAINDLGQVAGSFSSGSGAPDHAYSCRYSNGGLIDLGAMIDPNASSSATAINSFGHVAGYVESGSTTSAFLFVNGAVETFQAFGSSHTEALGLNDFDQVVGYFTASDGHAHAYLRHPTKRILDLRTFTGTDAAAYAINNSGQMTGNIFGRGFVHAFFAQACGTSVQELKVGNNSYSYAYSINQRGMVPLTYGAFDNATKGSLYSMGQFSDVPSFHGTYEFYALGINYWGAIVGTAHVADDLTSTGWAYRKGELVDLTSRLNAKGWTILSANGINNLGQIMCNGTNPQREAHPVILVPKMGYITLN